MYAPVKKGIRLLRAFTREVDRLAQYRVVFYAQKTYEKNIRPVNAAIPQFDNCPNKELYCSVKPARIQTAKAGKLGKNRRR
jgi:hypothetical protein